MLAVEVAVVTLVPSHTPIMTLILMVVVLLVLVLVLAAVLVVKRLNGLPLVVHGPPPVASLTNRVMNPTAGPRLM